MAAQQVISFHTSTWTPNHLGNNSRNTKKAMRGWLDIVHIWKDWIYHSHYFRILHTSPIPQVAPKCLRCPLVWPKQGEESPRQWLAEPGVSKSRTAACHPPLCLLSTGLPAWYPTCTQPNGKWRFRNTDAFWAFTACLNNWMAKRHPSAQLLADDQPWLLNEWTHELPTHQEHMERLWRLSPCVSHLGPFVLWHPRPLSSK